MIHASSVTKLLLLLLATYCRANAFSFIASSKPSLVGLLPRQQHSVKKIVLFASIKSESLEEEEEEDELRREYARVRRRRGGRSYYDDVDDNNLKDDSYENGRVSERYYDEDDDDKEYRYEDDYDEDYEEDDEYEDANDDDEYSFFGNGVIPNPLLDSIDPDGAADRFPELARDPRFWFDMLLFVFFLDLLSYFVPRDQIILV